MKEKKILQNTSKIVHDEVEKTSFLMFLKQKEQRNALFFLSAFYILLFILVHYCYPYPYGTADTGDYILNAYTGSYGGYRPIGYSWFLSFFHTISSSFSFISIAQFAMNAAATLYFLFTLKYFFPVKNKSVFYGFSIAVILSPVTLYLTHWAMSDSVFASLTLLWITSGIWLIHKLSWETATFHLLVLFLSIEVRFAGLFYPIITSIMLLYVHRTKGILYAILSISVAVYVYQDVKSTTRDIFKVDTFSGFSGWAQANNAVAILPYIDLNPEKIKDKEIRITHRIISQFPDSIFEKEKIIATSFIWDSKFPGKEVLYFLLDQNPKSDYVQGWIYTGTIMSKYSKFLIKKYPWEYFKHFLVMNAGQVFHPHITLSNYGEREVDEITKGWYDLKGLEKFEARFDIIGKYIAPLLRWGCSILWLIIGISAVYCFIRRKEFLYNKMQKNILFYFIGFAVIYLVFSIIAHPVHLRYLMPLHGLQIAFIFFVFNALESKKVIRGN